MAEIDQAQRERPDGSIQQVALKRLLPHYNEDEEFIAMLQDEARIMALLEHPNVARFYELGILDDRYFLVIEYIDGVDLRGLLRRCNERNEPLPLQLSLYIMEQALRGLHAAHELRDEAGRKLKLIHRDFSPSNILLSFDGAVKLIDFGVAKARLNRSRTGAGIIKGKLRYMSPEQSRGRSLDRRSDLFAAGVVLYRAVCGCHPFEAPNEAELRVALCKQKVEPPSAWISVDAGFDAIIKQALAKEREGRFPDAQSFAEALNAWREPLEPGELGRFLSRIFAWERQETAAQIRELGFAAPGEETPADQRRSYSCLVDTGLFETDPYIELDRWLEIQRDGS